MASRSGGFSPAARRATAAPASVAVPLAHGLDDGARVDALVDVQRDGGHLERGVLRLARPDKLRVEVRIVVQVFAGLYGRDGLNVVVGFVGGKERIGLRRHQTDWRIVDSLLVLVLVTINRTFRRLAARTFGTRHRLPDSLHFFVKSGLYSQPTPNTSGLASG